MSVNHNRRTLDDVLRIRTDVQPSTRRRRTVLSRGSTPHWKGLGLGLRTWYRVLATSVVVALAGCQGDGRTVLTVYSPHGKDLLQYYETRFEQAHPDVDVQWVDMRGATSRTSAWTSAPARW